MNREKNTDKNAAAKARQNRKKQLQDKGSTFSRRIQWKRSQIGRGQNQDLPRTTTTTPLSDISSSILNRTNISTSLLNRDFSSKSGLNTMPSTSQQQAHGKNKRSINLHGLGVNLMNRFNAVNPNSGKENNAHHFYNGPSSFSQQKFTTPSTSYTWTRSKNDSAGNSNNFPADDENISDHGNQGTDDFRWFNLDGINYIFNIQ